MARADPMPAPAMLPTPEPHIRFAGGDGSSCRQAVVIGGASHETEGVRAEQAVRRSVKTHRMVFDHIKAGEADKAAALWKKHLQKGEEYVLSGSELSTVVDLLE